MLDSLSQKFFTMVNLVASLLPSREFVCENFPDMSIDKDKWLDAWIEGTNKFIRGDANNQSFYLDNIYGSCTGTNPLEIAHQGQFDALPEGFDWGTTSLVLGVAGVTLGLSLYKLYQKGNSQETLQNSDQSLFDEDHYNAWYATQP